jgi:hypothetical protein
MQLLLATLLICKEMEAIHCVKHKKGREGKGKPDYSV